MRTRPVFSSWFWWLRFPAQDSNGCFSLADGNASPLQVVQNVVERLAMAAEQGQQTCAQSFGRGTGSCCLLKFVFQALENIQTNRASADAAETGSGEKAIGEPWFGFKRCDPGLRRRR